MQNDQIIDAIDISAYAKLTLAQTMDQLIAEGLSNADAAKIAQAVSSARGLRTKYTAGSITAHIKFRAAQSAKKAAKSA